jgi:hypothetical protein
VHVDLDVLCPLPLNWISTELQSVLVVTPDDDRPMKQNAQLSEKMSALAKDRAMASFFLLDQQIMLEPRLSE